MVGYGAMQVLYVKLQLLCA